MGPRAGQKEADKRLIRTERNQVGKQIEGLLDRILDTYSGTLIASYEKRIAKMEREKLTLDEDLENLRDPPHPFAQAFEHVMKFLSNHWKIWENGNPTAQCAVLRLAFAN